MSSIDPPVSASDRFILSSASRKILSDDIFARKGSRISFLSPSSAQKYIRRGRRPSFDRAMRAEEARSFYEEAAGILRRMGFHVETGIFGADMRIAYANDGPVTIIADSRELGLSDQASGCV